MLAFKNSNRLRMYREMIAVCCENKTHEHTVKKMSLCMFEQAVVHAFTIVV
jgi:hypothetical protein